MIVRGLPPANILTLAGGFTFYEKIGKIRSLKKSSTIYEPHEYHTRIPLTKAIRAIRYNFLNRRGGEKDSCK